MSRLAGSSGTQKVCETTKSRNRTEAGAGAKVAAKPPARPRDDITAQSHSVPGGQSCPVIFQVRTLRTVADARSYVSSVFSERISLSDGSSRSVAAYHEGRSVSEALFYVSSRAHRKWPARPRNGTTSCTVTSSLTRGLRVLRVFGAVSLLSWRVPTDCDDRHPPVQHRLVATLLAGVLWLVLVCRARQ